MTECMSTTRTDALDSWLTELTGGESSMRRLRTRLRAEAQRTDDSCCPTCQRPSTEEASHTGHWTAEPID